MGAFIARRIAAGIVLLLVASFLIYLLVSLSGNPLAALEANPHIAKATIAAARLQLHLNEPLLQRYWTWLTGFLQGNFGTATTGQAVGPQVLPRLVVTLQMVIPAVLISIVLGIVRRRGRRGAAVQHPRPPVHGAGLRVLLDPGLRARHPAQGLPGRRLQQGRRPHRALHHRPEHAGGDRLRERRGRRHRAHDPAGRHAGPDHLRDLEPLPASLDAGRAERGLHPAGPGQGAVAAPGALRARPAQRADPGDDRDRAGLRRHHRRRAGHRDRLRLGGLRPVLLSPG